MARAREGATQKIASDLRKQIEDGTLSPGALLPSEPELARQYKVSRQTARSALQTLEREGLAIVRPRRGRIVRSTQLLRWHLSEFERPDHTILTTSDAWETDIESQGHDPTRQDLEVEAITPPTDIAKRLKIDPDAKSCIVRRHLRYIDSKPAIIADDYFDEAIVRGTELAQPEDTTREDILKEAGYPQTYHIDEITTRTPTRDEAVRLNISPTTPVAQLVRTGFTPDDRAVRVMITVIPSNTLILQYITPA